MAQTVLITLTTAGADTGPFSLYSNINGFVLAFETNVSKEDLEAGYTSVLVPDNTTVIRVQSSNPVCDVYVDLNIVTTSTTSTSSTSTSSTSTSTTSTTTTSPPTTTTTTTAGEFDVDIYGKLEDTLLSGGVSIEYSFTNDGLDWATAGGGWADTSCTLRTTIPNIPSGTTLYIRVVSGPSSPVEFGYITGSLVCPAASPGQICLASTVITGNDTHALTVRVVANAVVGC